MDDNVIMHTFYSKFSIKLKLTYYVDKGFPSLSAGERLALHSKELKIPNS